MDDTAVTSNRTKTRHEFAKRLREILESHDLSPEHIEITFMDIADGEEPEQDPEDDPMDILLWFHQPVEGAAAGQKIPTDWLPELVASPMKLTEINVRNPPDDHVLFRITIPEIYR